MKAGRASRRRAAPGVDAPSVQFRRNLPGPVLLGAGHEDLAAASMDAVEQRQQPGAARRVQLAHDVVDEQDRLHPVHGPELPGLGHLERDGQRALLERLSHNGKSNASQAPR